MKKVKKPTPAQQAYYNRKKSPHLRRKYGVGKKAAPKLATKTIAKVVSGIVVGRKTATAVREGAKKFVVLGDGTGNVTRMELSDSLIYKLGSECIALSQPPFVR